MAGGRVSVDPPQRLKSMFFEKFSWAPTEWRKFFKKHWFQSLRRVNDIALIKFSPFLAIMSALQRGRGMQQYLWHTGRHQVCSLPCGRRGKKKHFSSYCKKLIKWYFFVSLLDAMSLCDMPRKFIHHDDIAPRPNIQNSRILWSVLRILCGYVDHQYHRLGTS